MLERATAVAHVLAASEVVPAEPRDLSDLIRAYGTNFLDGDWSALTYQDSLRAYLRTELDPVRVKYWEDRVQQVMAANDQVSVFLLSEPRYPDNLRASYDAPPLVWIRGTLLHSDKKSLAIVGSRRTTQAALNFTYKTARLAADAGLTVVSGLAQGVDTQAHIGALDAGGRTIAVLGSAIDSPIYPHANQHLALQIESQGALLSQFPLGSPPTRSSFVIRNSVISGLTPASLIVAAAAQSGTRTEAEFALKQKRQVLFWHHAWQRESWIQSFSTHPNVHIVKTSDEVIEYALRGCE